MTTFACRVRQTIHSWKWLCVLGSTPLAACCLATTLFAQDRPPTPAPTPAPAPPPAPAASTAKGIVAGKIIDKASGEPIPFANVLIVGTRIGTQTDLDGRYRIVGVPAGIQSVRAMRIGNAPVQIDSVRVQPGVSTTVDFALSEVTVELESMKVKGAPPRATSEDALLALQKSAPRVSDGISAQAIKRAPGSNAGDAITRVTGVSVVDKKFAVIRGLAERYSNTLLNGVELPSPEPLKKIVPLDLFPSSLLESIVVTKTATPDRPGDFAGGSVEVSTKEFPDTRVAEVSLSLGYGSRSTFRNESQLPQGGIDFLGFDRGRQRQMPSNPPASFDSPESERFAEQLRNIWTPAPTRISPDLGLGLSLGGRFGSETSPLGYAVSVTYNRKTDFSPDRFSQLIFSGETGIANQGYTAHENTVRADLGAIVNLAARVGQSTKFGWKNLYTRNAEEMLLQSSGFDNDISILERRIYQARYITRDLFQTQFTGDHILNLFFQSRLEWKATLATAARDEPENRSLVYFKEPDGGFILSRSAPNLYWFRFLDDNVKTVQFDWNLPLGGFFRDGTRLKVGGLYRTRDRGFDASLFKLYVQPGQETSDALRLLPEQAIAAENLGSVFDLRYEGETALSYESDDDIKAQYIMLDLPLLSRLRLVGGLRREDWRLAMYPGTKDDPRGETIRRHDRDNLWSGNLTWTLTDRQNLRFAYAGTIARPDPRELSPEFYVAVTGDCAYRGNLDVQRTKIQNGDVRWELYPSPGELFSISGFYKHFDRPIIELLSYQGSVACTNEYRNAEQARVIGGEFELRKALPGAFNNFAVGVNLTLVSSKAELRPSPGIVQYRRLQGQSNYLINLNLMYANPDRGLDGSLLFNSFGDRVTRYGYADVSEGELRQVPHLMEKGRMTLDGKIQKRLSRGLTASLSGRNLTNAEVKYYQGSDVGIVTAGYQRPGTSFTLGLGYAIR